MAATERVSFAELHAPYLPLLPKAPGRILDVGAGIGRDASVLAEKGHVVTAVEPLLQFVDVAERTYGEAKIRWVVDSLPKLGRLDKPDEDYDFILVSAVWHHLTADERISAMSRLSELTSPGGILALSLRNGPAGVGAHVIPTDSGETIELAGSLGFETVVSSLNQPSLIAEKAEVTWSKLAFRRL